MYQSNNGAACTCVVTEYRYHDRADYAVAVELFTEAELKDQLSKLVEAYRHNHFHSADMETEEERRHWADRAQLASDTFDAMFADRVTNAMLRADGSDSGVVRSLLDLAMDVRSTFDIDGNAVRDSLEECSELLFQLTSVRHSDDATPGPVMWPYIKKIR